MATDKTELGDRMKLYERAHRIHLTPRMPVILRMDGVAFHTLTQKFEKPLDIRMYRAMNSAAKMLCQRIQGACFAYIQSDEISILVIDYKKLTSNAWFDKNLQKMVSVSASIAGTTFTKHLREEEKVDAVGYFDARVIQVPREDVDNYFLWRQRDCVRNSIQMLAQANFPHNALQNLDTDQLLDKLLAEKGIDWMTTPRQQRYGSYVHRVIREIEFLNKKTQKMEPSLRSSWEDVPAPLFHLIETRAKIIGMVNPEIPEEALEESE